MSGAAGKKAKEVEEKTGTLLVPEYMKDCLNLTEPSQVRAYSKDGKIEAEASGDLASIVVLGTALLAHIALNAKDVNPDDGLNWFIDAVASSAKDIVNGTTEAEGEHYGS